jgi:hypothetical protein
MLRTLCVVLGLLASMLSSGGCRSCSSCHDYDPPVANCEGCSCCSCGTCRAGSAGGAYTGPNPVPGEYPEGYVETEGQAVEPAPADPEPMPR